jgi:hypothetical protein
MLYQGVVGADSLPAVVVAGGLGHFSITFEVTSTLRFTTIVVKVIGSKQSSVMEQQRRGHVVSQEPGALIPAGCCHVASSPRC